jgi:O-antigen ligase
VYLVTVIPFVAYRIMASAGWRRAGYTALMALNVLMLYLTHQRGALVALVLETLIFFWFFRRWVVPAILGLCLLTVLVLPKNIIYHGEARLDIRAEETENYKNTINSRIALWRFTVKEIADHPFKGIGFGRHSFSEAYTQFKGTEHWHSLNTFLNITIQLGVQGLTALLFIIYRLSREYWSCIKGSKGDARYLYLALLMSMSGFFARNMFDDHYVDDNGAMFWVLMGLGLAVAVAAKRAVPGPGSGNATYG